MTVYGRCYPRAITWLDRSVRDEITRAETLAASLTAAGRSCGGVTPFPPSALLPPIAVISAFISARPSHSSCSAFSVLKKREDGYA